jgi:Fic family protein
MYNWSRLDTIGYTLGHFMIDTSCLAITSEMLILISELDEFKGVWKSLGKLAPERLKALRRIATIESVGSSTRIEGVRLTDEEVEKLLSRLETTSFVSRDEEEVAGYAITMEIVFDSFASIPLTENYLKQLHGMLLQYASKDIRHRGQYKTVNNHVEAFDAEGKSLGVVFATASPFETPLKMQELISWWETEAVNRKLHPLLRIGIFTVVFLAIHPFQDGNGRLSRILTTLLLLKEGYAYVPYSSLENVVEQNKESYYLNLRRTQATLSSDNINWVPWLTFFLKCLQQQKQTLELKVTYDKQVMAGLSTLSATLMEMASKQDRFTMKDAIALTGANRSTLKKHLSDLVQDGLLARGGKGAGTWYTKG